MDFGKVDDISKVNFNLPPDHPFTGQVLPSFKTSEPPRCFVGPPIWANKEWVGKIYPTTAKEKDFLYHYTRQFNTIELNVTHYQIPSETTIQRWIDAAAPSFCFCPKWPQTISHEYQLKGCEHLSQEFTSSVLELGEHLGTTFLQLGPAFDTSQFHTLSAFLKQLPPNFPIAVEFRHPDWFSNESIWQKTIEMLQKLGMGTVMSDVAGRRDVLHMSLTSPILTLRFVGNELHPTDFTRVDAWVQRLKDWYAQGLQTAYIFVHCGENINAPELTKYWIEQLNLHCGLSLQPPHIRPKVIQGSLF
ncbi:DUF72 domain-containing protein [Runella aurantiaca]|uniref:DUF72 domain-containing protein n=1 Tax=Runella aurantiaca TaxID=2282308 RepID=A0A369IH27_9BACT|nr:DUF72 domain-containing protein [Runella aurantiaca]RDB07657.1 DUF72 domain-containing protein [Runella aurantiaca]